MEDERWEEAFMSQLGKPSDQTQVDEEAEDNIRSESLPIPKITSYKEAMLWRMSRPFLTAVDICRLQLHIIIGPAVDAITSLKVTSMIQHSLHDYFS